MHPEAKLFASEGAVPSGPAGASFSSSDPAFDVSWPPEARALVARAIERHGGWGLWSRLRSVSYQLVSLSGLLAAYKGYPRRFSLPRSLTVYPKLGRAVWRDSPAGAAVMVFDRGDMHVLEPGTGPRASAAHRQTLQGWRKLGRWRRVDAGFFFAYALTSYTWMPFLLPSLRFVALSRARWRGRPLAGVRVELPAGAEVHCRVQDFYFDADGLIRRNDYVADVVGAWATGAHGWDDFVTVNGLSLPTRRTVLWRWGRWAWPAPAVLRATFTDLTVQLAEETDP